MLKGILRKERGSALVELALVVPLLCLVLIGAAELGRIAYYSIEVADAARAGVAFGSASTGTADFTDMKTAATAAAPDISNLTFPSPPTGNSYTPCTCETINTSTGVIVSTAIAICGGTSSTAASQCPQNTAAGTTNVVANYVQLWTQAKISTMFNYPGLPTSYTLNGYAKMRVIQN